MRARVAVPIAVCASLVLLSAVVYITQESQILRAGHSISDPVAVTADSVHVSAPTKGTLAHAVVGYSTPSGHLRQKLLSGGHSTNYYLPPVRLVYDRRDPTKVMLADDWRAANATSLSVKVWLAVSLGGLAALTLLFLVVALVRRPRPSGAGAVQVQPPTRAKFSEPWLTDDPDYQSLVAYQQSVAPQEVTERDGRP